ncbi:hypothetical protein Smp_164750 [Schistosoma mansoni]|uniref:Transposase n=1 Tax=Schistosoma mansoni TaxID=6183 RepID=C4QII0_SCHMA|nr:hypothetical protein Smp_164750 [Schistosoma mansoni]|eukprot:XP_018644310.1 hypothetical protein Smp_164750 [Schistosoma mansoni]
MRGKTIKKERSLNAKSHRKKVVPQGKYLPGPSSTRLVENAISKEWNWSVNRVEAL